MSGMGWIAVCRLSGIVHTEAAATGVRRGYQSMSEVWQRIGDNDFAGFGRKEIMARRSDNGDTYLVVADDSDQDQVRLTYNGVGLLLEVERKFISPEGVYRLSGGLSDRGDGFGIERYAWVELLLTSPAVLSYWGNAILLRQDFEA